MIKKVNYKIYRHYWKNKKNAGWKHPDNIDSTVWSWLESSIKKLQKEKPKYYILKNNNRTVFLYYQTIKEEFYKEDRKNRYVTEVCAIQVDAVFHDIESMKKFIDKKISLSMIEEEFANEKTEAFIQINDKDIKSLAKDEEEATENNESKSQEKPTISIKTILTATITLLTIIIILLIVKTILSDKDPDVNNGNQEKIGENNHPQTIQEKYPRMCNDEVISSINKSEKKHCHISFILHKCANNEGSYLSWIKNHGLSSNPLYCKKVITIIKSRPLLTPEEIITRDIHLKEWIKDNDKKREKSFFTTPTD